MSEFRLSDFQTRVLLVPEAFDLFLGGGRGGGKSFAVGALILRHCEAYGERARVLYVRQTYKGLADFEEIARDLFAKAYGQGFRFNATEHVFRLPNGAYVELGQMEGPGCYPKFQGRSFTLLVVDEAGQYATPDLIDRLRSNLRGDSAMPLRCVLSANPGGPGHAWLSKRYVFRAGPWRPFIEPATNREAVYCPSTYRDNAAIDQAAYAAQLAASCASDPELLRAWLNGDWAIARGAFFGPAIDESRNAVDTWKYIPAKWERFLAHDFGVSAPSVTYVVARSPGDHGPDKRFYAPGSLVLVDELSTHDPMSLNQGLGWNIPKLSDAIRHMAGRLKCEPNGVADDAIFSATGSASGAIADEFRRGGVHFSPARKGDRITGWQVMRRLLANGGKPDVSALYVARHCDYWWSTVPYLPRDPRRIEDVDSRAPDHAADATRYACIYERQTVRVTRLTGA